MEADDIPRWRGFNIQGKFMADEEERFREEDFRWIADWGFNFVRLPMDYRCWTGDDWLDFKEDALEEIDQAIEYGRKHRIHVSLNFHRAPGFTVANPPEPTDLWTDEQTQDVFVQHWRRFAERYEGIPGEMLSFDLVNEPVDVSNEDYAEIVRRAVEAIHEADPDRLVFANGTFYGQNPVPEIADLDCAQSTRGYDPRPISHYMAEWTNGERYDEPTWPLDTEEHGYWDQSRYYEERIAPWKQLEAQGVGVHIGEWGAYNHTPHDVTLAWMEDVLQLWEEADWGWALWNFRGPFGILDSDRDDADYEDYHGHDLDREMLNLLQRY